MPKWFSRDDFPDELKEMDPKDIVEAVKKSKESDGKIKVLEDQVKESKSAFESFSNDFNGKLEAKFAELTTKARENGGDRGGDRGGDNNRRQPETTTFTDFLVDPEKAMNERIAAGMQPLVAVTLQNAGYSAKTAARERMQRLQRANPGKVFDGYFFEKFESEIDALAAKVPANQLANPETWEHLYYNVKGRHADEIAAQVKDGKAEFLIEPGTQTHRQADADQGTKLTEQELRIAAKLGQTPEKNLEQRNKINSTAMGVNV